MLKIFIIITLCFTNYLFANDKDFEKIFNEKKIDGTIVLESLKTKEKFIFNEKRASLLLSPASTFKIPHTLIALNENIVTVDSIIIWDKTDKGMENWNKNQTLSSAFKFSCVWCYKEFTKKIKKQKYENYLEQFSYGNKIIGNDISDFWLDGSLKISTFQQVDFLKRLYKNDLPFEQKNIDILKEIMVDEKTEDFTIRAKSGWSTRFESESAWYVGYIESKNDVWFFATNLITKGQKDLPLRKEITLKALRVKGIIN